MNTVLTVDELADLLRVSRWSIYESVKRGDIAPVLHLGRSIRIPRATVARLLGEIPKEGDEIGVDP